MRSSSLGWCAGVGLLAAAAACNEELVETVPTSECASGKRWVGELTASPEMFPGQNCVDCHRALDGPPLFAAGTVYGLPDLDGGRTVDGYCFGVEGARVTLTTADGARLQTLTNRAGNFFFEGSIDSLVTPYQAEIEFTLPDGRRTVQTMKTQPSNGDCGSCHNPHAEGTDGAEAGGTPAADVVIGNGFPLYTGPLYE